jgi:hypothetical protein
MSSRKERPSTRKVEPPDWASDVKPDEDVMAMFYAPTGLPKAGPLIPPSTITSEATSSNSRKFEPHPNPDTNLSKPDAGDESIVDSENTGLNQDAEARIEQARLQKELGRDAKESHGAESLSLNREEEEITRSAGPIESRVARPEGAEGGRKPGTADRDVLATTEEAVSSLDQLPLRPDPNDSDFASTQVREFEECYGEWIPFLTKGQEKVLRALFALTYAIGREECMTSTSQLAAAADMSLRQTASVAGDLERLGFLTRPETYNTRTRKGTIFRLFLTRQTDPPRVRRQYYWEDR